MGRASPSINAGPMSGCCVPARRAASDVVNGLANDRVQSRYRAGLTGPVSWGARVNPPGDAACKCTDRLPKLTETPDPQERLNRLLGKLGAIWRLGNRGRTTIPLRHRGGGRILDQDPRR